MCKNDWALHYVVIKIYDGVQVYLMAKELVVRTFNRPNNILYANSNGYAIHNNKGDQVSSIAAILAIYHHMITGPPEESVESQHSYCPNGNKTWCKYHKDKIFNRNIYDRSKCLPFSFLGELHVNVGSLKIRPSPLTT